MSASGQNTHQLKLDIQHELITANQLLNAIKTEMQSIKNLTVPGGPLESVVKQSAASIKTLANIQQVHIDNIAPLRRQVDTDVTITNQNQTNQDESTLRNENEQDDCQMTLVY